jgi:hypothetical protein
MVKSELSRQEGQRWLSGHSQRMFRHHEGALLDLAQYRPQSKLPAPLSRQ